MRYPKDPYHLNASLKNSKKNNQDIFDSGFKNMVEMLKGGSEVFEVGFDFGQRLLHLKEKGVSVLGGVEFDPVFGLYKAHSNLFDHGWSIRFTQLDFWNPVKQDVVITNHFLDIFPPSYQVVLLDKLKGMSNNLYLNENLELDFEKYDGIYVYENKSNEKLNQIELPDTESLKPKEYEKEEDAGNNN